MSDSIQQIIKSILATGVFPASLNDGENKLNGAGPHEFPRFCRMPRESTTSIRAKASLHSCSYRVGVPWPVGIDMWIHGSDSSGLVQYVREDMGFSGVPKKLLQSFAYNDKQPNRQSRTALQQRFQPLSIKY